jgi:NTP pyrophosphatase (non-canonical NTP hydrolase)
MLTEEIIRKTDNLTIRDMQLRAWQNSENHGFHAEPVDFATRLMLIVSELAEAMEEHRAGHALNQTYLGAGGKPEGIPAELADAIIRIGDLAGVCGFDLEGAVIQKMRYNEGRPHKHGKAY